MAQNDNQDWLIKIWVVPSKCGLTMEIDMILLHKACTKPKK